MMIKPIDGEEILSPSLEEAAATDDEGDFSVVNVTAPPRRSSSERARQEILERQTEEH